MNDAELVCLIRAVGLSTVDLAELGGVTDRQARRWMAGATPVPEDVVTALMLLDDDLDAMTESIVAEIEDGARVIEVWRSNAELRAAVDRFPARGRAAGAFAGSQQLAALAAREIVAEARGIEVQIRFARPGA